MWVLPFEVLFQLVLFTKCFWTYSAEERLGIHVDQHVVLQICALYASVLALFTFEPFVFRMYASMLVKVTFEGKWFQASGKITVVRPLASVTPHMLVKIALRHKSSCAEGTGKFALSGVKHDVSLQIIFPWQTLTTDMAGISNRCEFIIDII